ncbi:hypothetical protein KAU85_00410 [Candidatus Bathyarchaeota archaeon]|nr:hypothetical protein [Candidatus Bathyarchaeota archaeon]MCK4481838.1 hypothetical protein [Candidatus Bathyarchaeota archaeon]
MKVKNKQDDSKGFSGDKRPIYVLITILVIIILISYFLYQYPNQPSQPKAAIIDQLSSSQLTGSRFPNQIFITTVKELLYRRFPQVDYYSDNATVDQYKHLSSLGYKLIIWRAHSALDENHFIAICSSEKYIEGKYSEYSAEQLTLCNITGDPNLYFAITPKFVEECMSGRFEDTVIVFMSCNGLKQGYYKTAEAFKEKGVKVFISWNGWIEPPDNDQAISLLLDHLINKNNTISEAVNEAPSYLYPYGSSALDYYPRPEVADYIIPNYKEDNVASNVGLAVTAISRKRLKLKRLFQFRMPANQNMVESTLQLFSYG